MKKLFKDPAKCTLAVLLAAYLFFFTSKLTLGNVLTGEALDCTPLNEPMSLSNDIEVTLTAWRYSPSQELMEVEMDIVNMRSDLNRELIFTSAVRNGSSSAGKNVFCETVITDSRHSVVWIRTGGKDFTEVTLKVKDPDGNVLSLYASVDTMTVTDSIEKLGPSGYLLRRYEEALGEIERRMEDLMETRGLKVTEKGNLEKLTEELFTDTSVATEEDLRKRDEIYARNEERIRSIEKEIGLIDSELEELSGKEDELKQLIKELKEDTDEEED